MFNLDDIIRRAEAARNEDSGEPDDFEEPEELPQTEEDRLFKEILYDALVILNLEDLGKYDESLKMDPVEMEKLYQALEEKEARWRTMLKSDSGSPANR